MDKITEFRQKMKENVDLTISVINEMSDEDVSKLVHELWVRQIELEMQNEDLRKAQVQLETSQKKYSKLYDCAPVGYCILNQGGFILEVNLTAAEQLGVERCVLLNTLFEQYIIEEDRKVFCQHLEKIFTIKTRQTCDIRLIRKNTSQFYVRLESIFGQDTENHFNQCRTAILDMTEYKFTQDQLREHEEQLYQGIHNLPVMIATSDEPVNVTLWDRECKRKRRVMDLEQEKKRLQKEIFTLKSTIKDRYRFGDIIGKSTVMQNLYEQILKAAAADANVFIYGESGTGKELVARAIHKLSKRRDQRFVPVNCSAIPESLFESEFFGHRKGSFTGAFRDKQGFFMAAHKGTLFLDELGELQPTMQVKLLRVFDDGEYTPIGETSIKKVDVRIIAATNRNVEDMRKRGLIREDFFFRLHIFAITVPPLRERKEDIPLLVDHFVKRFSSGESFPAIPANVMEMLYNYDWPGNVREFQNAIQRYLSGQPLDFIDPWKGKFSRSEAVSDVAIKQETREIREVMDDFEKKLILSVLEQYRWNKSKAAAKLGIPRRTLYRKMEKYGIL